MQSYTQMQSYIYKTVGERELSLWFLPPAVRVYDRAPLYLLLPGGGWHSVNVQQTFDFFEPSIAPLRQAGWAVAVLYYRNAWEDAGVPLDTVISDCMDGGRYLSRHAKELGIDPHRVVTGGLSAGGHLSLMLALAPHSGFVADSPFDAAADDFLVRGAVSVSPPTILWYDAAGYVPHTMEDTEELFVPWAGDPKDSAAAHHRASPIDYITPLSVPTLLICGSHDGLILPENSHRYARRSRELGTQSKVLELQFGGHCMEPMVEGRKVSPSHEDAQAQAAAFAMNCIL